jgi:predicted carbohydrate-binding protein with CBM5 and CBM33 domain
MAKKIAVKPLIEMDKPHKGKVLRYWQSAKAAAAYYNINVVNISQNVTGQTHQAKGHYFRYATAKEIEDFSKIVEHIEEPKSVIQPAIDDINDIPESPTPVIPEAPQADDDQRDTASNFARLLEEAKKKIKYNSK